MKAVSNNYIKNVFQKYLILYFDTRMLNTQEKKKLSVGEIQLSNDKKFNTITIIFIRVKLAVTFTLCFFTWDDICDFILFFWDPLVWYFCFILFILILLLVFISFILLSYSVIICFLFWISQVIAIFLLTIFLSYFSVPGRKRCAELIIKLLLWWLIIIF